LRNNAQENVLKPTLAQLLERLMHAFPEAAIQIEDEGHFQVQVIDARFEGLQRLARHRLIYTVMSDWIPKRVHALSIIAMTLKEASNASAIQ